MEVVKGSLREHLGVASGCACILWETGKRGVVEFVEGLKGQEVIGVFGRCDNPKNDMLGYQFARGIVERVTSQQQLMFQGSPSLSLRNACDIVPVSNIRVRDEGSIFLYSFEAEPFGRGKLLQARIGADSVGAYMMLTPSGENPSMHTLTGARPVDLVKSYDCGR